MVGQAPPYMTCQFNLDRSEFFVFFEGTTAAGIPLNDEKFGMLCGKHINIVMRKIKEVTYEL